MTLTEARIHYRQGLRLDNKAARTIEGYDWVLKQFTNFVGDRDIQAVNLDTVNTYRQFLIDKKVAASTYKLQVVTLRMFSEFVGKNLKIPFINHEDINIPSVPKPFIYIPTWDEINKIFSLIPFDDVGLRDRALIEFFMSTGCRLNEVHKLNKEHINFEEREFLITGKGSNKRVGLITKRAMVWLKLYLKMRGPDEIPALFINLSQITRNADKRGYQDYARLSKTHIERILQRLVIKAGIINKITIHTLRHFYGTNLIVNGADVSYVQKLMGHEDIRTTQGYVHLSKKNLKMCFEKCFKYGETIQYEPASMANIL